jgi:hypothetical protein
MPASQNCHRQPAADSYPIQGVDETKVRTGSGETVIDFSGNWKNFFVYAQVGINAQL